MSLDTLTMQWLVSITQAMGPDQTPSGVAARLLRMVMIKTGSVMASLPPAPAPTLAEEIADEFVNLALAEPEPWRTLH